MASRTSPRGGTAAWTFTAPAGTYISGYSLYRFAASDGGPGWDKGYVLYQDALTSTPLMQSSPVSSRAAARTSAVRAIRMHLATRSFGDRSASSD